MKLPGWSAPQVTHNIFAPARRRWCHGWVTPSKTPGLDEFNRLLDDPGLLAAMTFLRGHLLLEQALTRLIELNAVDAAALRLERQSFSSKLSICQALGFLPAELASGVRAVNTERNRLAHRVEAKVDPASMEALLQRLPVNIRMSIEAVKEAAPQSDNYRRAAASEDLSAMGVAAVERAIEIYVAGMDLKLTMQALFLVLSMAMGHELQLAEYRKEHGEKIAAFELACAMREEPPSEAERERIRQRLDLPVEPHPRGALGALFGERRG